MKSKKLYAIDIETTGIKKLETEVARISIVKYDFIQKKYVKVYDQKFLPQDDFTESATSKNGLTKKKLKNCPRFSAEHANKILQVLSEPEYIVCFNEDYDFY